MNQVRYDKADQKAAPSHKASCKGIGLIVALPYVRENAFACFNTNVRMIAQNLGDSNDRQAKFTRDILHLHCHAITILTALDSSFIRHR